MADAQVSGPAGLGGWLVLVAIGLVLSPLKLLASAGFFVPIFRDGTWAILTTPGSEAYHPLWAPLLGLMLVGDVGFVAASLWLLVLFFRRSRSFPRLYVWVALLNLFFNLALCLSPFVLTEGPMNAPELPRN